MEKLEEKEEHIRQIELELAQTKLALVEAHCRNQDLSHQVSSTADFNCTFLIHGDIFHHIISLFR